MKKSEARVLDSLGSSRADVNGSTVPLWAEKKLDTSDISAFSEDYKKSLTSCRHCSNGTCPTCKMRRKVTPEGKAEHADQGNLEADVAYFDESQTISQEDADKIAKAFMSVAHKGGPGSGYFDHPGDSDGDWGGSAPRDAEDRFNEVMEYRKFLRKLEKQEAHQRRVETLKTVAKVGGATALGATLGVGAFKLIPLARKASIASMAGKKRVITAANQSKVVSRLSKVGAAAQAWVKANPQKAAFGLGGALLGASVALDNKEEDELAKLIAQMTDEQFLDFIITVLEDQSEDGAKGGPGSGYHGPRPSESDSDWGGSAPRSGGEPNLRKAVESRVKFQKNRLSKEVVSHASRIRQLEEKPFRTLADRSEARRNMKALREKTKELGIQEQQVWEVIDELPANQQAYLASLAHVKKNDSKAAKAVRNIGRHLALSGVSRLAARKDPKGEYMFAPSPLSEPETVSKFSFAETAAYLAAHGNPKLAPAFIKALTEGDIDKAKRIRSIGAQDIISNWSRNTRNENYLRAAGEVHKLVKRRQNANPEYYVTAREREKMISQLLKEESDQALSGFRKKPSKMVPGRENREPLFPIGGFGGKS